MNCGHVLITPLLVPISACYYSESRNAITSYFKSLIFTNKNSIGGLDIIEVCLIIYTFSLNTCSTEQLCTLNWLPISSIDCCSLSSVYNWDTNMIVYEEIESSP